MDKTFEALISNGRALPLSATEREKLRAAYGDSWKFTVAAREYKIYVLLEELDESLHRK